MEPWKPFSIRFVTNVDLKTSLVRSNAGASNRSISLVEIDFVILTLGFFNLTGFKLESRLKVSEIFRFASFFRVRQAKPVQKHCWNQHGDLFAFMNDKNKLITFNGKTIS